MKFTTTQTLRVTDERGRPVRDESGQRLKKEVEVSRDVSVADLHVRFLLRESSQPGALPLMTMHAGILRSTTIKARELEPDETRAVLALVKKALPGLELDLGDEDEPNLEDLRDRAHDLEQAEGNTASDVARLLQDVINVAPEALARAGGDLLTNIVSGLDDLIFVPDASARGPESVERGDIGDVATDAPNTPRDGGGGAPNA